MAYIREASEKLEVSYPLAKIWKAIPKTLEVLKWQAMETDETKHYLKIKTKGAFLSYASTMQVSLEVIDAQTTKLIAAIETPVTTITSMIDYGRSRERIDQFITTLANLLEKEKTK